MILWQNKFVLNFLTGFKPHYHAIALWPFVIVKSKKIALNKQILNHEKIHLAQQKELLLIGFYFIYVFEFCCLFVYHKNWRKAYKSISFEKEAFANESNFLYLKERKFFNQWRTNND